MRTITDMYRRWLSGGLKPNRPQAKLQPHTRRRQAEQLAACLDAALSSRRRTGGGRR
jgi:hypothetical protein